MDVIDIHENRYLRSISGLRGVAGALVCEAQNLIFTSNRGEDTVAMISVEDEGRGVPIPVGRRPNGLAYDPGRAVLLCANVGSPDGDPGPSVTFVDVLGRRPLGTLPMPGRTRWAIFDPGRQRFFVNIASPFQIVVIDPDALDRVETSFDVPARGPHGLELNRSGGHVLCACDEGKLVALDAASGTASGMLDLSGPPDVVFLNRRLGRLYVAIGDPGVIDVIDVKAWVRLEVVLTESGAHTIALDEDTDRVFAFLPHSHQAAVFQDEA